MIKLNKYIILILFLQIFNLYSQSEWVDEEIENYSFQKLKATSNVLRYVYLEEENLLYSYSDDDTLRQIDISTGIIISKKNLAIKNKFSKAIKYIDFSKDLKNALIISDTNIIAYDLINDSIKYTKGINKLTLLKYTNQLIPIDYFNVYLTPDGISFIISINATFKDAIIPYETVIGVLEKYNFETGKLEIAYSKSPFGLYNLSIACSKNQKYVAYSSYTYDRYRTSPHDYFYENYDFKAKCNDLKYTSKLDVKLGTNQKYSTDFRFLSFSDDNKALSAYNFTYNTLFFLDTEKDTILKYITIDSNSNIYNSRFIYNDKYLVFITTSNLYNKSNYINILDYNSNSIIDSIQIGKNDISILGFSKNQNYILFKSINGDLLKLSTDFLNKKVRSKFYTHQTNVIYNDKVIFNDISIGNIVSWKWDFGDSSSSIEQNPTHIFKKSGDFSVKLIVFDGNQYDTLININYIKVRIKASIVRNSNLHLVGKVPFGVQFYNDSKGESLTYKWYFGDGDSSDLENPSHTYNQKGYFSVRLIISDGFYIDSLILLYYVEVLLPITASFSASNYYGEAPFKVQFYDYSAGNIKKYKWFFGDGDSSELKNPIHIYKSLGHYSVKLIVSDLIYIDSLIKGNVIYIYQTLKSDFELSSNIGEAPFRVDFINKSTGEIKSNKWYFGDGSSSTLTNPIHTYTIAGNFTVSLVVSDDNTSSTYSKEKFISVSDNTNVDSGTSKTETPPFSPNPVKDKLSIQISEFNEVDKIQILDLKGRKIIETELKESIDVSSLSKGIYFLKIGDKEWKFLKE